MQYRNTEIKIDQFVGYCNEGKIDLSPAFQRGHVWKVKDRANLLRTILLKRPIPAVFLYKEASGSKYSYIILDGKQRLESLILYIGNKREDLKIAKYTGYFADKNIKDQAHFAVDLGNNRTATIADLSNAEIRDLREYSIPTIEITLDDETNIDEIISLFIDINQQGVPVSRFNIVKAIGSDDPLLKSSFALVAEKRVAGNDKRYMLKDNDIAKVLKRLKEVNTQPDQSRKVEKLWERLVDMVLYLRSRQHRKSSEILQLYLKPTKQPDRLRHKLTNREENHIKRGFKFVNSILANSRATDDFKTNYTHLYTLATIVISDHMDHDPKQGFDWHPYQQAFDQLSQKPSNSKHIKDYHDASFRHTNDVSSRNRRDTAFRALLAVKKAPNKKN